MVYFEETSVTNAKANQSRSKEALYLLSIPGMKASIRKGLKTPFQKCAKKLEW